MTRRHRFIAWMSLVLLASLLASCSGLAGEPAIVATLPPATHPPVQSISLPQSAPNIANGATIYAANCTRCHGASGKGDGEMVASGQVTGVPDFTDPNLTNDAAPIDWYEIVTNGRLDKLMPPWDQKLSEAERWDVTLYVYTLADTSAKLAQGKTVWEAQCADCHGQVGEGTSKGAQLPNLLKANTTELLNAVANGIPDKMTAFADKLSADDRAAAVAYARSLSLGNTSAPVQVAAAPTAAATSGQEPATTQEPNAQPATTADANVTTTGSVTGKVVNMTPGGTVPADLELTLYVVSGQTAQAPEQVLTTKTKTDGTYQFDNVPFGTDQHYVVMTTYNDTVFTSNMLPGDPTHPQVDLPVNIYETTDDASKVKITEMVTLVQVSPTSNQLQVVQILTFTNDSDHAYVKQVDGKPVSTTIKLPKGAIFQDFSGGQYQVSADGTEVTDSEPVMPGSPHLMHLGYTLPYSDQMSIDQPLDFALNGKVQVLIASKGLSITGDQFGSLGSTQMGGQTYQSYGGDFTRAAGTSVRYSINGSVAATTTTSASSNPISPLAYILIAIGLVAIGTAIGFFLRERTDQRSQPAPQSQSQSQINTLMKQIADLDVRHNAGKISETQYLKRRSALKAQLVDLMKDKSQSGGESASE